MPLLDVSFETYDPDFADNFVVTRRKETFDHGRMSTIDTIIPGVVGVIDAATPDELQRFPELEVTQKVISIVTNFRLMASGKIGADTYQPDKITYRGTDYIIIAVDDFSQFGGGTIECFAASVLRNDPPPQGSPP